ncbi:MAG TPA: amidohydrolase family protein, partial [bacterium]|nr:amidohydrolase family protein [bacterium]
VEDSVKGITVNGARSVKRESTKGSIAVGKDADLVIMDTPSWIYPVYHFAHNHVHKVFIKGRALDLFEEKNLI